MSPSLETGCSEVSTTVTLIDGNASTGKDDSSRSTTTSPAIEHPKEQKKIISNSEKRDMYENQDTGDKVEGNSEDTTINQKNKSRGEVINVEDDYDCQEEDICSRLKKYDYLGLYKNRTVSPENSTGFVNILGNGSANNNRKTNNSKVRVNVNISFF